MRHSITIKQYTTDNEYVESNPDLEEVYMSESLIDPPPPSDVFEIGYPMIGYEIIGYSGPGVIRI